MALHGGPGARGAAHGLAAGVARTGDGAFRVIEPWQRRSGGPPLTVERHVEDLGALVDARLAGAPFLLVGHSWGAMLALAFAAAHPGWADGLALVGCGTFDERSRARMEATRLARLGEAGRARLLALAEERPDPDGRMRAAAKLISLADSVDPMDGALEELAAPDLVDVDAAGSAETWADVLERQRRGVDPDSFGTIRGPVLMLHGAHDPHPGPMVRDALRRRIARLEYRELPACGHTPWWERGVRDEFLAALCAWMRRVPVGPPRP